MKKINVELWFDDDFVPPKGLDAPCEENDWDCKCQGYCPFHTWDDQFGSGCGFRGAGHKEGTCPLEKYFIEEEKSMDEIVNCGGIPCGGSMYELLSMHKGYDDITFAAMELILEKGPDALMYQLNYDDVERVKMFPTICKRAIELGILTEEELAGWDAFTDTPGK